MNLEENKCLDMNTVVVSMNKIVKKFGDFTAVDHVDLTIHKGEVHAILGENGAGKSTLMNILYGMYECTSGKIFINDEEVVMDSPKKAMILNWYGSSAFYAGTTFTVTKILFLDGAYKRHNCRFEVCKRFCYRLI